MCCLDHRVVDNIWRWCAWREINWEQRPVWSSWGWQGLQICSNRFSWKYTNVSTNVKMRIEFISLCICFLSQPVRMLCNFGLKGTFGAYIFHWELNLMKVGFFVYSSVSQLETDKTIHVDSNREPFRHKEIRFRCAHNTPQCLWYTPDPGIPLIFPNFKTFVVWISISFWIGIIAFALLEVLF